RSFTRLLAIEAVLPIISSIGPTLLICYFYVFKLSLIEFAFFLDFCNAWLPTVGASSIFLTFKPFRDKILNPRTIMSRVALSTQTHSRYNSRQTREFVTNQK